LKKVRYIPDKEEYDFFIKPFIDAKEKAAKKNQVNNK